MATVSHGGLIRTLLTLALLVLACAFVDHPLARWTFVLAVLAFPVALTGLAVVGTASAAGYRPLLWPAAALVGSGAAVLATAGSAGGPRILGLPPATVILLLGLGALTLVIVALVYAATFDRFGPSARDLERLRARRRAGHDSAGRR